MDELKVASDRYGFARLYVEALEETRADLEEYLNQSPEKRSSFVRHLLAESYTSVARVPLLSYFGGRTVITRHSLKLMERYPLICDYFYAASQDRLSWALDIDRVRESLAKAAECIKEYETIASLQESQEKLAPAQLKQLDIACAAFSAKLVENYPHGHPTSKAHYVHSHIAESAYFWGNIGRGNEQGYEGSHGEYMYILSRRYLLFNVEYTHFLSLSRLSFQLYSTVWQNSFSPYQVLRQGRLYCLNSLELLDLATLKIY